MKTKISAAILGIVFLAACGSSDTSKDQATDAAAVGASEKFSIKASNMQYLSVGANGVLIANQTDPTKAEVFEKISLGNGKYNLKVSNGKFVCDDRAKSDSVFADKTNASDWEQFEVINIDATKINIKSSTGKYLSADLGSGAFVAAKQDKASDWETFIIEKK
jgi:major membrane immunogen (membrane-anchored lipoprotein)